MEMLKKGNIMVVYQRQGMDKNGNPLYIIDVFELTENNYYFNINFKIDVKKDKYNNIKITSYNINDSIKYLISLIK